jgi:Transposase
MPWQTFSYFYKVRRSYSGKNYQRGKADQRICQTTGSIDTFRTAYEKLIGSTVTDHNGIPVLAYSLKSDAYAELADTYLGKNIIITDNHNWSTEDIILTYRSQYIIEDVFKQMKDRKTGTWWPMFHWTDQMIMVHGLYCSLSLLIRSLILKRIQEAEMSMSMNKLHGKLSGIREVLNVFPKGKKKQSTQSVVTKMDEVQQRLFDLFRMEQYLSS